MWAAGEHNGAGLTRAELRLLPLLATHLSFREIGARLYVSRNTVKTQAISVYRKLGVSSRSDAIDHAARLGLVAVPSQPARRRPSHPRRVRRCHPRSADPERVMRILIIAAVAIYLVFWVRALIDLARRRDLTGSTKAGWVIVLLVLPFIGLAIYTMLRPARV